MTTLKNAGRQLSRKVKQSTDGVYGELGMLNADGSYSVRVPDTSNYVYVRIAGDAAQTIEALNIRTAWRAQLPVYVRQDANRRWEVVSVAALEADIFLGEAAGAANYPPAAVAPDIILPSDQFKPGRCRPLNGTDLQVYIEKFSSGALVLGDTTIDLATVSITASKHAWIVISINPTTNAPTATLGTEYGLLYKPLSAELAAAVTIPANDIRLWAYDVISGDTRLSSDPARSADLRDWLGAVGGTMSSFDVQADTFIVTIDDGDTLKFTGATGGLSTTVVAAGTLKTMAVALNINSLTADATPDLGADYVATYDASASGHKKVLLSDIGGGTMNDFDLAADTGTAETVGDGETLTLAGGDGISTAVAATNTVTTALDIPGLTEETTVDEANDFFVIYSDSAAAHRKVKGANVPGGSGAFTPAGTFWQPFACPASPSASDDEFADNSGGLPNGWTEYDHGTDTTEVEEAYGVVIDKASTATSTAGGMYKALPSGDFTIWTHVSLMIPAAGVGGSKGIYAGIGLFEDASSATGDAAMLCLNVTSAVPFVYLLAWTAYNALTGSVASVTSSSNPAAVALSMFLRARRTGSSYTWEFSHDGRDVIRLGTDALGFTPTHMGLCVNNLNTGLTIPAVFSFFRYANADNGQIPIEGQRVKYYS